MLGPQKLSATYVPRVGLLTIINSSMQDAIEILPSADCSAFAPPSPLQRTSAWNSPGGMCYLARRRVGDSHCKLSRLRLFGLGLANPFDLGYCGRRSWPIHGTPPGSVISASSNCRGRVWYSKPSQAVR